MSSAPQESQLSMSKSIGVFDSGVGGEAVARAIRAALPDREVMCVNDAEHLPYGDKPPEVLLTYVLPKLQFLVDQGCEAIVIACNTVTTTLIEPLRQTVPVPLVGMEPMVKPAVGMTKKGVIAVCATPNTLKSKRYDWLKNTYAKPTGVSVLEPDCSDWARMIEDRTIDRQRIESIVDEVCGAGADVIVLGCTHYHWIEDIISSRSADRAIVIQPEAPVVAQLKRVLGLHP